jgi:hypothetical protein
MADFASNVASSVDINAIASGWAAAGNLMTYVIIAFIIAGGFIFVLWKSKALYSYPNTVMIYQIKNGVLAAAGIDHIRKVEDKKNEKKEIEFKKTGKRWTHPTYEAFIQMKKGSLLHLKELSENSYEIIDPKQFLFATPDDYKKYENEAAQRFAKNTSDESLRNKYKADNPWKGIMDILPVAIVLISVGIAFWLIGQFFLGPLMQQITPIAATLLDRAVSSLEASNRMFDAAMRFCGQSQACMDNMGINSSYVIGNSTVAA